jgi:type I restriction enzyme, S subunit
MAIQFIEKELGDCLELVIDHRGKTPKKLGADWTTSGVPTISAKNVNGGRLVAIEDIRHVSHDVYKRWMKEDVKRGDCFLVSEGATLGECLLWDYDYPVVLGQRIFCLRANPAILYPRYLYAYMTSPSFQSEIIGRATGTSVDGLRQTEVLKLKVRLPPLPEQREIGDTLYNLDKMIELNRRMNATLEAMARALFQSWFVDFDPVRAKLDGRTPVGLDSKTAAHFPAHFDREAEGVVPTGWRATTLSEVIEISDSKRIPLSGREREARQGKYPYHGAASVMDYVDDFLFDGIYALMGEDGSVVNEDGTPVLQYVWGKFWVNNHAHVLRGKNGISTEHLFLHLKGSNIAPFVNGAVQPKLNQGNMNRIPFMLPPPEIGQAFAKAIEPLFAQIRANTDQSRTLATLRDSLLPKLLSGELSLAERKH